MILDYYNALAKSTSQTVIIQTFNGKSSKPSAETIASLAREHPIYGYVKDESPGLRVNGRMEQLLRANTFRAR
jgi:dihydrodipicolinate synthase/N-acetylneuraminate lyase